MVQPPYIPSTAFTNVHFSIKPSVLLLPLSPSLTMTNFFFHSTSFICIAPRYLKQQTSSTISPFKISSTSYHLFFLDTTILIQCLETLTSDFLQKISPNTITNFCKLSTESATRRVSSTSNNLSISHSRPLCSNTTPLSKTHAPLTSPHKS